MPDDVPDLAPPYTTAHFVLAISELASVNFAKCTGLSGEVSVEEYHEGGENRFVHRLPTRTSFPNLVLSHGVGETDELWAWFAEFSRTGWVRPREGSVVLKSVVDGKPVAVRVWAFTRGWPVKITGPDLDAQSPSAAIDVIEIAHHGLVLKEG